MTAQFSHIGIIGKRNGAGVNETITRLYAHLREHPQRVTLETQTAAGLEGFYGDTLEREQLGAACDLVVVVGGDGTLLNAGRAVAPHGTPLLGVNLGRLGFMVDVLPAEMPATLDQVLAGEFVRDQRLLLSAQIGRAGSDETAGPFHALNDIVIRNHDFARVLEFDTTTDGDFISHHRADGIITATPTGSTAYALSGGGPVLHPEMDAIVMVPICPHTLSDRPLVLDAGRHIEIAVDPAEGSQALFTADGQMTQTLGAGDRVRIERAEHRLTLIHPPGYDYFNILRNKLQWGRGQRRPERSPASD